jgi:hypothetical protein
MRPAPHLLRREDAEEPDGAIPDDRDGCAGLHVRGIGCEPTGAHHVGQRQQTRDQIVRWHARCGDEGAIGERNAQQRCLRAADEFFVCTGGLITRATVWTRIVGGEERTDHELPALDRCHRGPNLFDDAAVFVAHWGRLGVPADTAVGPQVGPAHAARRQPDDRVRRFDNRGLRALFEPHIARAIQNSSSHYLLPRPPEQFRPTNRTNCGRFVQESAYRVA